MDSLCKRPMADMDKLRTKAAKFMQMEELKSYVIPPK